MKLRWFIPIVVLLPLSLKGSEPVPPARIATLVINPTGVTPLHLRPDFDSVIRMPEEITSVVLGSPESFKAEHNEGEPKRGQFGSGNRLSNRISCFSRISRRFYAGSSLNGVSDSSHKTRRQRRDCQCDKHVWIVRAVNDTDTATSGKWATANRPVRSASGVYIGEVVEEVLPDLQKQPFFQHFTEYSPGPCSAGPEVTRLDRVASTAAQPAVSSIV